MFSDSITILNEGKLAMTTETARALCFLAKCVLHMEVGAFDAMIKEEFGYAIQKIDYMVEEDRADECLEESKKMRCMCILEIRADAPFRMLMRLMELEAEAIISVKQFGTSLLVF